MSKLDDIALSHSVGLYMTDDEGDFVPVNAEALAKLLKKDLSDFMLELADQVELETNITTGIPDAIALLCQKLSEL